MDEQGAVAAIRAIHEVFMLTEAGATGPLAELGLTPATALVQRVPDPQDRRSRALVLTEKGRQVRAQVMRTTVQSSPLSALDPDDVTTLLSILDKIAPASERVRDS